MLASLETLIIIRAIWWCRSHHQDGDKGFLFTDKLHGQFSAVPSAAMNKRNWFAWFLIGLFITCYGTAGLLTYRDPAPRFHLAIPVGFSTIVAALWMRYRVRR